MDIIKLLKEAVQKSASDLHVTVGMPPVLRINGVLVPLDHPPLTSENTQQMAQQLLEEEKYRTFTEEGELDFSYSLAGVGRFRINAYRQRGNVGIACRIINPEVPSISSLNMPEIVTELSHRSKGLLLVTGPTGSGKSTTLASMINLINEEKACHILTLEDPIEYLHGHKRSIINQREIGTDSASFPQALRSALRQDPDVILVGEMRNLETISIAITAAETGHLVLATLHTVDAPQTIDRIIDVFPPHQQQQIRIQLANTLLGVIAQKLLPRRDQRGRIATVEVLVSNTAVRNLIREGKIHQLHSAMQTSGKYGMQTMDSSLQGLYKQGIINKEDAIAQAMDQESMMQSLERSSSSPGTRPTK